MSLKPLNDRVLVKRLESEERTASGLYIPDTAKEKPSKGEVVAVGPGKHADDGKLVPMAVKVGDMVLFNKYAGTEVKIDGAEHLVCLLYTSRPPGRASRRDVRKAIRHPLRELRPALSRAHPAAP